MAAGEKPVTPAFKLAATAGHDVVMTKAFKPAAKNKVMAAGEKPVKPTFKPAASDEAPYRPPGSPPFDRAGFSPPRHAGASLPSLPGTSVDEAGADFEEV